MMQKLKGRMIYVLAFLLLVIISSCEKEYISFGSNFVDNSITNLILVDSSTLELSSLYVDSFITSSTGALFAGNYTDPQFGKIGSESYLKIAVPTSVTIPNGAVFDSVDVIMKPNKTFYGDTASSYTISIHQLNDPIKLGTSQTSFYNINSLAYNATPLGTKQLVISPNKTDSISIRLTQALGQDLFNKFKTNDEAIQSQEQFNNYFKGLAFTGSSSNNLMMGFGDSIVLRLHYNRPDVIVKEETIDFTISDAGVQFNHITADRTGTPIAALSSTNKQLLSSQTNGIAYSQYISGVVAKIRFPYLRNLLYVPNFVKVIRAELTVTPITNSYAYPYTLPPYMPLSTTDQYNQLGSYLVEYSSSSTSATTQYGSLYIDKVYGTGTVYTYDVTTYVQQQLATSEINKNGLLMLAESPALSFNRLAFGTDKTNAKTQLKVYYISAQ